ncbi:hypothetical protein [Rickettsia asembonensis]|nr:hypothetical protein [Rickettsia asembonensis]
MRGYRCHSCESRNPKKNSLIIDKINLKNKFFVGFTGFPLSRE